MSVSPRLLALDRVSRQFGGVRAVDEVTFSVRPGSITGLIGPNGAGKSTVLGLVAGMIRPNAGTITLDGSCISGLPPFRVARSGVTRTFQLAGVFDRLTVLENLLMGRRELRGDSVRGAFLGRRHWKSHERTVVAEAQGLLDRFELLEKADEYAGDLSGGQKRIVEILRAVMARPRLLLLDEPIAGVSPRITPRIGDLLEALRDEGLTILMVEHELGVVERLCDPIVVMGQGKVIAQGTMAEVRSSEEVIDAYLGR